MAGTENRHLAAGSGGAGAASDQPHARHWTNLALATGQCKAQAKTGRFLPRPGAILTPMGEEHTASVHTSIGQTPSGRFSAQDLHRGQDGYYGGGVTH